AGHVASAQARFIQTSRESPRLERVFLTWGNRNGLGAGVATALRALLAAGPPGASDTTLAGRWALAQRLFVQLDSALQARDFERFGTVYRQLAELFESPRQLAPVSPPQ
ncbi:MAG: hypothetical protein ACREMF_07445, partial [Gemmatimonadales bacterium]